MQEQTKAELLPVWVERTADDAAAVAGLRAQLGCPEAIAQILVGRKIVHRCADAEAFFHPRMEALLDSDATDPMQMLGMRRAVERVLAAIRAGEPILIYGDYDVDGTTATVLLKTAIERVAAAMAAAADGGGEATMCRIASAKATGCRRVCWGWRRVRACGW